MPYGLKYQTQFTSQSDENIPEKDYTLQFLFKNYTGNAMSVTGGDVTVVQRCTIDDPVAPVKGQSLSIQLVNYGNLPIEVFQSDDDDGVQVKLLQDGNVLFIGYLVQDDFYETMVDFTHTITLSATDGLGLLKGVILSDAEVRRAFTASFRTNGVDTVVYMYVTNSAFYPQAGNTIEILGTSYIIDTAVNEDTTIGIATYNWTITLTTTTGGIAQTVDTIYLTGEINLLNRNSLLSMIAVCLAQTNLELITNIFLNLYEYRQDNTITTLEQTLIDSQLFISGETYEDCYSVLTKIMETFYCSISQSNGQWNIVHWHEARNYTNNAIPGFQYDETWTAIGTTVFNNNFFVGLSPQLTRPIAGLMKGAMRGYKFSRKTFDYVQPKYLLRNSDLLILGDLIRTYVDSGITISEYVATNWQGGVGPVYADRFIRVAVDSTGTELYRVLVVSGPHSDSTQAVASDYIEMSEGDKLKFSCSFRTNISQGGVLVIVFAVRLYDGTTTRYVDEVPAGNGTWISTVGFSYTISAGDNTDTLHTVEIESSQTPFQGMVTCFLPVVTQSPHNSSRETLYQDMRLEIIPYINDSTKINGQIHKQEQPANKKNNSDVAIFMDDAPRNSIAGCLFLPTKTPDTFWGLQDRTTYWRYPPDANGWRLGELTTLEELRWRQQTRSKLEGGFIGNYQNSVISLLTMVITEFNTSKNYTFGLLTIDYKRNQFSGTLWELYDTEQPELDNDYTLTYKYSTE